MSLSEKFNLFLSTGFYSGYSPYFPGTVGTIVAIPFAIFFNEFLSPALYLSLIIFLICYGSFLCWDAERLLCKKDAKEIVFDEWIGYFISTFTVPVTLKTYFMAFIFFRIFDIWKPFPIKIIDEKGGRGIGVVLDDVAAGIITLIIMKIFF